MIKVVYITKIVSNDGYDLIKCFDKTLANINSYMFDDVLHIDTTRTWINNVYKEMIECEPYP